ncbi:MAG TPA: glycosyltransferase [Ktedonobacterales bacterium]
MCFRVAMLSLHTSPLAPLGRTRDAGGMNVYVRELARELGRGSIYVDIFTRRSDPSTPLIQWLSEHVRIVSLPAGPAVPLPPTELFPYVEEFTRHVARFAERAPHGYDLVHSHYWLSGVAGMALARQWDTPHVIMFHTVERLKGQRYGPGAVPVSPAGATRIEYEARLAAHADTIIVSTESERDQLRRLYGLSPELLRIIPCGVDLRVFTPGTRGERASARRALDFGDEPVILFVGRLDPIKGIDLLLESVAQMRERARLVIVGGNPDGDPELQRLRGRADELGIGSRVALPGAVPQPDLVRYYRAADLLALTSRYESFGLAAVEALACGTPVVASAVGGLPSIVRDGINGRLVPCRTPEAFAEAFDVLCADDRLRARLAANAHASVAAYDWHRIGDRVRALYQELTAEQRLVAACSCS